MNVNGEKVAVPDSWDQDESDVADALSDLNVGAKPFVPNAFAPAFIPRAAPQPAPVNSVTPNDTAPEEKAVEQIEESPQEPQTQNIEPEPTTRPETPPEETQVPEEETGDGKMVEEVKQKPTQTKPRIESESETEEVKKDHLNVVFIGHVDAGKSTIGGQIMFLTGMVDKRTLEKYEREAKEKNRETWYLSWVVDTNLEEREKGKTVEVGRAYFETETKHFTILDAPGHRSFVPNMIGGTSQADVAVLVISARKGEFETGFERGGQTREHAMLAKTAGVKKLIVLINKMDDPTVKWREERYTECVQKLLPFLKKVGFRKDIHFMPCSGLTGANLLKPQANNHPYYDGLPLIPYLDNLPVIERSDQGPVRIAIVDKYKDMGVMVLGKLESGKINKGMYLTMQPNKQKVKIMSISSDEADTDEAFAGENVKLRIDNVEEDEVSKGFVLCSPDNLCTTGNVFDAQIMLIEYKSIICAGYSAIMHVHTCAEEVEIKQLLCILDRKTGEKQKGRPRFVKQDQTFNARMQTAGPICIESFKDFPQMGRFTLRDEGKTIAVGKILKVRD